MAFMAPSTLLAEVLAEGTLCGFEFQANSRRVVQLQSICTADIPFSLRSSERHPRPGLKAIPCPSGAINSVIEEVVHSPALLGSKRRVFSLACVLFHQS